MITICRKNLGLAILSIISNLACLGAHFEPLLLSMPVLWTSNELVESSGSLENVVNPFEGRLCIRPTLYEAKAARYLSSRELVHIFYLYSRQLCLLRLLGGERRQFLCCTVIALDLVKR